jgi:hypothetical protein
MGTRCGLQSGQEETGGQLSGVLQAFWISAQAIWQKLLLQEVSNAIPLAGEACVVGDGHWLGSLPGWYASICVKLFPLALSLHCTFNLLH